MREDILEAKNLRFAFDRNKPILEGISTRFGRGELSVIAGRNGSGKTVFAKCLAGIYRSAGAPILFEGKPLLGLPGSPATRVAYPFQDARLQLLGDSLIEDVLFGPLALGLERKEAEARALAALDGVGLAGKEGEAAIELSGGDARRLAIAAVLALEPKILILDEPFANLDWKGVSSVLAVLEDLRRRKTTLIVLTHELEKIVGMADRLLILDRGCLVADGSSEDLVGPGLEEHGLRNPLRPIASLRELAWLDPPMDPWADP